MKACVKAWQAVIDPKTGKVHDELGLRALDAIMYGPLWKIDSVSAEIRGKMIAECKTLHPDFRYDCLEIVTDEQQTETE